jgi:hypothetical protein
VLIKYTLEVDLKGKGRGVKICIQGSKINHLIFYNNY